MGAHQRRKGANFERKIARWMKALGDFWRQTDETQQGNVGDVRDRTSRFPLVVQAKHQKQPSPWKAMEEAETACRGEDIPVAIVRRHGGEDLVIHRPEGYMRLMSTLSTLAGLQGKTVAEAIMEHGIYDEGL